MTTLSRIRLRDGRTLSYSEHGDARGRPLLYFHGFPGSGIEAELVADDAQRRGVRIVAPDRPGMGGSSFAPGRTLRDWAADVAELADALGLARFPVIGASGGGPYALACARVIPDRLSAVGVACSLAPVDDAALLHGMLFWNRVGLRVARQAPWLARPVLSAIAPLMRSSSERFARRLALELPPPDRELLADPAVRAILAASFRASFRGGGRGPASDARIYARPWGFELGDIALPVHLWHGGRDAVVPEAMGRRLARELPHCTSAFLPDEGHFSLVVRRAGEILGALLD